MRPTVLVAAAALLATPACRIDWSERLTGTGLGAIAGGALGGLAAVGGSTAAGIALGGLAGAAAGYIIGDFLADDRERAAGAPPGAPPTPVDPRWAPEDVPASGTATDPASYRVAPVTGGAATSDLGRPPDPGAFGPAAKGASAREEYDAGRRAPTANEALRRYAAAIRLARAVDPSYEPARFNLRRLAGG
jgi:hypothetical protein